MSKNGRLNVWECDTKLDGLVKLSRDGDSDDENDDEDKKVDDEFLTDKKKTSNDIDIDHSDNSDEQTKKKFYIAYTKKAK